MGIETSQKSSSSRHRLTAAIVVAAGLVAIPAALGLAWWQRPDPERSARVDTAPASGADSTPRTGAAASDRPLSLRGVPLRAPTNMRLLVADAPAPFVLDVDRGTIQPITGLPTAGDRGVSVTAVGRDVLVLSSRLCNRCRPDDGVYLVRRGSAAATRLGRTIEAVSARDGGSVWTLSRRDTRVCTVREIDLDGRPRRAARPISCRTGLIAELPAGVLFRFVGPLGMNAHSALLEPGGRVVRVGDPGVQPVVGNLVLSGAGRNAPLVLRDVRSGAGHTLSWPSGRGYSLGEVTGDPGGRLAIVRFARFSPQHMLDIWLLDTQTHRWEHLPGMPARIVPKTTDVEWTTDGRVVILSGNVLGVWRPGSRHLAVREVRPSKQPGSSFVIW